MTYPLVLLGFMDAGMTYKPNVNLKRLDTLSGQVNGVDEAVAKISNRR